MTDEKQFFTPTEAAEYLSKRTGRPISVGRLAQLRRERRVNATVSKGNVTLYTKEDLDAADISPKIERSSDDEMDEAA